MSSGTFQANHDPELGHGHRRINRGNLPVTRCYARACAAPEIPPSTVCGVHFAYRGDGEVESHSAVKRRDKPCLTRVIAFTFRFRHGLEALKPRKDILRIKNRQATGSLTVQINPWGERYNLLAQQELQILTTGTTKSSDFQMDYFAGEVHVWCNHADGYMATREGVEVANGVDQCAGD